MAIIFSYVVLEKMISLHNNKMIDLHSGHSNQFKEGAAMLLKHSPPAKSWQKQSQLKSLKTLPASSKEQPKSGGKISKKPHLVDVSIKEKHVDSVSDAKRHAWKKEAHPKHKGKVKKNHHKGQRHISPEEYKIMFKNTKVLVKCRL